jgi:hypothetical protein
MLLMFVAQRELIKKTWRINKKAKQLKVQKMHVINVHRTKIINKAT